MHKTHVSVFGDWLARKMIDHFGDIKECLRACVVARVRGDSGLGDFLKRSDFKEYFRRRRALGLIEDDREEFKSWVVSPLDIEDDDGSDTPLSLIKGEGRKLRAADFEGMNDRDMIAYALHHLRADKGRDEE